MNQEILCSLIFFNLVDIKYLHLHKYILIFLFSIFFSTSNLEQFFSYKLPVDDLLIASIALFIRIFPYNDQIYNRSSSKISKKKRERKKERRKEKNKRKIKDGNYVCKTC